ncbi:MAG TPA: integrase arm-type DNA-binding domain-containing protein [Aromatoleum sp.]|uniref:tyrosine-type recombinase/integrase n=1 Tax=Aromatoleum sp. TaxID=2307007 RepID=UPI002B4A76B7|nr:integrase arm-type DNA-binding domain-containing protein [Aromatoleum sp.]HJV26864.1 integrase arm-type DNA-binding domain-containing protein [Aromatoleum sp.]
MLTDTACRNAEAIDKPRKLADDKGLYLLISSSGAKYWRMDYRYAGKRKTLALGVYPETSLKSARQKRDDARRALDLGDDPSEVRRQEKVARKVAAATSFEAVAREWYEKKAHEWVPDYASKVITSLEQDLFPSIGRRPVTEITASDLLAALRKVEARGALETLKRVRQRASDVFLYAIATGRAENNPVAGLYKALKTAPAKHRPALHPSDLRDFFIRLEVVRVSDLVKHAVRLLTLTFLRPGELRGGRWEEIDLESGTWIVPAERDRERGLVGMKMREAHTVPLSSQAVDLLRRIYSITGDRDLVFPNRNDPRRPMSDGTINSALRAMGYSGDEVTGHGFRTTATGALLEMGYRPEVIDRQLAHRERKQVFGAYSHQAEYLTERRKMMQQWGDYLDQLEHGAAVIPFRSNTAA